MIYYDKIGVSKGIDVNKTSKSKERDICHYWHFFKKGFKFQANMCNRCHDLLMISMVLSDAAILNIKNADYHCIISGISKSEAISLKNNIDLIQKNHYETLKCVITRKMGKEILIFGDTDIGQNKFYHNKNPIF